MCKVLIFGGTTEGRILAEYCSENRIPAYVSVVSEYGRELLKEDLYVRPLTGPMDAGPVSYTHLSSALIPILQRLKLKPKGRR